MNIHEHFMGMAIEEAKRAYRRLEVPIGAVLIGRQGEILGRAHNGPIALCDPTAHAEILALRQASEVTGNYRLPGTVLYVTLEPCVMCLGALLQARVRTLVYGASDSKAGAAGSVVDLTRMPVFNHYIEVVEGVRAEESAELLRRFFQERRQEQKERVRGEVPKWP